VHAEEYLYSYFQFHRDFPTDPAEIDRMIKEVATRTKQAGTFVSPTLYVFRQIISQIADIDAVLERPEMRYMPPESTSAWRPSEKTRFSTSLLESLPSATSLIPLTN